MSTPVDLVRAFAARHGLWRRETRVLAAVSGGSDSVAMAHLLHELAGAGDLVLAGLAHVNHHLRGEAGDGDEACCRALAARLGLPVIVAHADVPTLRRAHGGSVEVAAREARWQALADAAAALGADRIATAHTRNDQAETVLLHLVRGAGLAGARGILPQAGVRIRPLLDCSRDGLRSWLAARGEPWREDASNAELANPRNRLRHVVLPELAGHLNPAVDVALARFAEIARDDEAYLAAAAAEAAARVVAGGGDGPVRLDAGGLLALAPALQRRVARLALDAAAPGRAFDLAGAEAVVAACRDASDGAWDLPGVRMERSGAFVVLVHRRPTSSSPPPGFHEVLTLPGRVQLGDSGRTVEADGPFSRADADGILQAAMLQDAADSSDHVLVRADELAGGLVVRSRRPGDRVRLAAGRKKVQDLFVDRKVDRRERDRVPIVTDAGGRIVWVAGHAVGEEFRVGPPTDKVVILTLRPRDGAGRHR